MKNALVKKIQPYAARMITGDKALKAKRSFYEGKRRLLSQPHKVDVFLRINDPYSYLLVQTMAEFASRFRIDIGFRTIKNLQDDMYPEEDMWHINGFIDATHLAKLYDLDWPEKRPDLESDALMALGTQRLLQLEREQDVDWTAVESVFRDYWFQRTFDSTAQNDSAALDRQLADNERVLIEQGHYMSAMLHYGGEWYWGLDRLDHLEKRFNALGLAKSDMTVKVKFDRTYRDFCSGETLKSRNTHTKKLTLYFSIRSPYSHLALVQGLKLAEHYQLDFEIKPVLPMIMRGLLVPDTKKMYIFHDTKREASKLGIDYGYVADPLGKGVERCYTLFLYAKSLGKENAYLLNYAEAVNAQGIHSDTDEGLKIIVERTGLDWAQCRTLLDDPSANEKWMIWAEENRQEMVGLGSWGVPTFRYGDLVLWGQDRVGLVELAIRGDVAISE